MHFHSMTILALLFLPLQNEDLAALAAQQYYVEVGEQMVPERLNRMVSSVIPDSLLAGPGTQEKWVQMIMAYFKRVSPAFRPSSPPFPSPPLPSSPKYSGLSPIIFLSFDENFFHFSLRTCVTGLTGLV